MCLYSPANTIEMCDSGKRIYFDWEEFRQPVSEAEGTWYTMYDGKSYDENVFSVEVLRGSEICEFHAGWNDTGIATDNTWFDIVFENGTLLESGVMTNDGEFIKKYESLDEVPVYFDMPNLTSITIFEGLTYGTAPCFYAPYRLMVYRGGEWQSVEDMLNIDTATDKIELSATSAMLLTNADYGFGEVAELTITFADGDPTKRNEYMFSFTSGETATVLTLPSSVQWANELTVEANKRYEISVVDNIGLWCAVDLAVTAE